MKLYNLIQFYRKKAKKSPNALLTLCSLMSTRSNDLSAFIIHCKEMSSTIEKEGITTNITNFTERRRKNLGLPPIELNKDDVKKLPSSVKVTKKSEAEE